MSAEFSRVWVNSRARTSKSSSSATVVRMASYSLKARDMASCDDYYNALDGRGEGGIRTHERVTPLAVFKTAALNHSATSPGRHSMAQRTHSLQALRAPPRLPQESLKISMRCLPAGKRRGWPQ